MPKIKNIIIFISIGAVLVSLYVLFLKPDGSEDANLVSTPTDSSFGGSLENGGAASPATENFLSLLLSVQNIQLEDSIFANPAFQSLHDSSIVLTPDGNEGRTNPFARLGSDPASPPPPALSSSVQADVEENTGTSDSTADAIE